MLLALGMLSNTFSKTTEHFFLTDKCEAEGQVTDCLVLTNLSLLVCHQG